jgi:GlpG protein
MSAYKAVETAVGLRLAEFSRLLWAQRVAHRIIDHEGRQIILVGREEDVETVRVAFERWQRGEIDSSTTPGVSQAPGWWRLLQLLRSHPVTLVAILLSVIGAAVVSFDHDGRLLRWLTFTDFQRAPTGRIVFEQVSVTYARGEYWRLLTPVFLHFGPLHLAFNMLWLWELGRRIELARGRLTLAGIILISGAGGDIAQYLIGGSVMFGGMSGVIYGLLGYAWMWNRFSGVPGLELQRGVLVFMLAWLLICMSGFVEAIGFGAVANSAHAAGLVLGMVLGVAAALLYSRPPSSGPDQPSP